MHVGCWHWLFKAVLSASGLRKFSLSRRLMTQIIDFSNEQLLLELGYLVPVQSPAQTIQDFDGVLPFATTGSSISELSRQLRKSRATRLSKLAARLAEIEPAVVLPFALGFAPLVALAPLAEIHADTNRDSGVRRR